MRKLQKKSLKLRFKEGSCLHNIKRQGKVASFPEDPAQIINEGGYTTQTFSVAAAAFCWRKGPSRAFHSWTEVSACFKGQAADSC